MKKHNNPGNKGNCRYFLSFAAFWRPVAGKKFLEGGNRAYLQRIRLIFLRYVPQPGRAPDAAGIAVNGLFQLSQNRIRKNVFRP